MKIIYVSHLLESSDADSLIIDSGSPLYYFQDDQTMPFKPNPNFSLFCPDRGAEHLLQIEKGKTPKLSFFSPSDFWHETSQLGSPFWSQGFEISVCGDKETLWKSLNVQSGSHIYLGANTDRIDGKNIKLPSREFLSAFHWGRIQKTEYEIQCIRKANEIASKGHAAAKKAFLSGSSERQINFKYMEGTGQFQNELPYANITALNEKAAVLHYHGARNIRDGKVFLIDAGATYMGYCADITRTYCTDKASQVFHDLLAGVDKIQKNLSVQILPGFNYPDLHGQACRNIAKLLIDSEILKNVSAEEAEDMELVSPFFPHGLGHALGLQVHDVGGKQMDAVGSPVDPNEKYPHLRTLRQLQENDVVTVEPGVYFIPMLLDPLRNDSKVKGHIDWTLVDGLLDHGGIRIEDNIVARSNGPQNLTREFLPN